MREASAMEEDYNRDDCGARCAFNIKDTRLEVRGWKVNPAQEAIRTIDDDVEGEDPIDRGGVGRDLAV